MSILPDKRRDKKIILIVAFVAAIAIPIIVKFHDSRPISRNNAQVIPNATSGVNNLNSDGDKLAAQQNYSHAIDKYYEAIKLDSKCFLCYYKLAQVYWVVRDYESSVSCLEAAIRLNPRWSLPYETLGDIYLKSKLAFPNRLEKAAENYRKAIYLEPSRIELRLSLAQSYEDAGEVKKAETEYEAILQIDPNNSTAISALKKLRNKADSR
jgi:tetratricopeptide (TPR) repeat protein